MQLTNAFGYALLMIAMTTTCATAEKRYEPGDRQEDKRLNRRESTIILEGPVDRGYHQRPNVLYKKVAKPKYGPPKAKYGPPKTKYGPGNVPPNFAKNKKHVNKTRYTKYRPQNGRYANFHKSSRRPIQKPVYGHQQKHRFTTSTNSYSEPANIEPASFKGFQAPNVEFKEYTGNRDFHKPGSKDFHDPMLSSYRHASYEEQPPSGERYGEPPRDSYGAPIKENLHDLAIPNSNVKQFPSFSINNDLDQYSSTNFAQKHRPDIGPMDQPKPAIFDSSAPGNEHAEMAISSYADIFNYKPRKETKKKTHQNVKFKNQWNGNPKKHAESEVIVGGQYAEPPARYVPKNNPSAAMFIDDSVFAPLGQLADTHGSAITSSYVNYKHSNMAFSPQNLNDAFSIIN